MADHKHPNKATIWRKGALDYNGNVAFSAPDHIYVRWEYENRLILTEDGRTEQGRATVYFPEDNYDIGDYIAQEHLTDTTPGQGAYEIRNKEATPNLSGTKYEYVGVI